MENLKILISFLKENKYVLNLSLGEFNINPTPIGQGGNGIVFESKIVDKVLAMKFLVSDSIGSTKIEKTKRFVAEYFNIKLLDDSKGIVKYVDFDVLNFSLDDKTYSFPIIIMEKYSNSLANKEFIKSEEEFFSLFKFLINTIKKIHTSGVIHRDLKPQNILEDNKNNYYLADFGIASYNPEYFSLMAETEKKERLGNRLFSAPEQENSGISAEKTMDIFSIGQILQWYFTGSTHRGTGRTRIVGLNPNFQIYDNIIEKCLEQNPKNRFQNIEEIENYIKQSREKRLFEYIRLFHFICTQSFPNNDRGFVHCSDPNKIDRFFCNLQKREKEFDNNLWWLDGYGSTEFTLTQKGNAIWKFCSSEFDITDIWIHYDGRVYNDFCLVKFKKSQPFELENETRYTSAIVDGKHHISYSEHNNGFAEINDEIIDLSLHNVEFTEKQNKDGFFVIGSRGHCIIEWKNENTISEFFDELNNESPTIEQLNDFSKKLRKHINDEIARDL